MKKVEYKRKIESLEKEVSDLSHKLDIVCFYSLGQELEVKAEWRLQRGIEKAINNAVFTGNGELYNAMSILSHI